MEEFVDVELTNNPICQENEGDQDCHMDTRHNKESENTVNTERDKSSIGNMLLYVNSIFSHMFVFSVFESLFFWFYVAKEENEALERQFENLIMVSNVLCLNVDIDLDPYYTYLENERSTYNNDVVMTNTIMLNVFLASALVFVNILLKMININVYEINVKIMKRNSLLFLLLFIYEYAFFKTIIYNYKPNSIMEITKKLFNQCINDDSHQS